MDRKVSISAVQIGPMSEDKQKNVEEILRLADEAIKENPDFVVFPEVCTTPYFTVCQERKFFDWAEPIPGPTTELLSEKAKKGNCHIVASIFEKGAVEGEYYCSAFVIGPDGKLVTGRFPDGSMLYCYRKNYLGDFPALPINDEYYWRRGPGYNVFATDKGKAGILICYDRWIPEGWRVLTLLGAEIIFVPTASSSFVRDAYTRTLMTWAQQFQVFVVSANRGGIETVEKQDTPYFGLSCIVGPYGNLLVQAGEARGPEIITASIDIDDVRAARRDFGMYNDRRPELYSILSRTIYP